MMEAVPDTVTEAVELLRAEGYDDDFDVCADGLCCAGEDGVHGLEGASVDQLFRFEGESDPGDEAIVLGVNALDYSGYPDCRPEFLAAFEEVARLGTRVGVEGQPIRVLAPLLRWSKAEIVEAGERLGVPWALTLSCYDPVPSPGGPPRPCGHCDACQLRAKGFAEAGVRDPAL